MLEAVESHLGKGGGRRDLRFKPQKNQHLTEMEQFEKLELDDPWEDANMLELLDYLMTSKRIRTEGILLLTSIGQAFIHAFNCWKEFRPQRSNDKRIGICGPTRSNDFLKFCQSISRIPAQWHDAMHSFYDEYRSRVT